MDHLNSGLVVFNLLAISWVTIFFTLPSCHRFGDVARTLKILSVVQSCLVFTFALALLISARTFGSNPECNRNAVVVLFRPFSALDVGRIVGWIVVVTVLAIYGGITTLEYTPSKVKEAIAQQVQAWRSKTILAVAEPPAGPTANVDLESGDNPPTLKVLGRGMQKVMHRHV
jgi:hypothetical protein